MEIQERIKNIKEYFRLFNVVEDMVYVLVNFPETWTLPGEEDLSENVQYSVSEKGTYFITKDINDIDAIFDSIEHVIELNKSLEERVSLFNEKIKELKSIFSEKTLEELRGLKFTFATDVTLPDISFKEPKIIEKGKKNNAPLPKDKKKGDKNEPHSEAEKNVSEETPMMALVEKIVNE